MEVEVLKTVKNPSEYLGEYAIKGGPGRPKGMKNKFTQLKETLLDAFNSEPDALEALKRTLFIEREYSDGSKKKFVDMEALRAIISVLPKEKDDDGESGININIAVAHLGKLSTEDLRALANLGRARGRDQQIGSESVSSS